MVIDSLDDYHALVRAEVYQDVDDQVPIAVNLAEKRFAVDPSGQEAPFLEEAITSAVGRALGTAGFNLLSVLATADEFSMKPLYPSNRFDPAPYARQTDDGGFFLEADAKVAWFRSVFPNGKICTSVYLRNDVTAVVRADVYLDKEDKFPASTNYAARSLGADEFAQNYVQTAATAAIGRALTNAGFNLVGAVDDWEDSVVDTPVMMAGVPENQPTARQAQSPAAPPLPDTAAEASQTREKQVSGGDAFFEELYQNYLAEKEAAQTGSGFLEPEMPEMSKEDARQTIITFGQHKGEMLGSVDPETIEWIATKYRGKNNAVKAAASILYGKR